MSLSDEQFIKRCIALAKRSRPFPNPYVGCVLVYKGKIVAEGCHKGPGTDHAEVATLKKLPKKIDPRKVVLYTNLEPCSHYGKTPPCVDVIIEAEIKKVVIGVLDPNPEVVKNRGIVTLRKAGVSVKVGVLKNECEILNEQFFYFHKNKRPFVALKIATTLDGKITLKKGTQTNITSKKARDYARSLRAQYQAILVGVNTVHIDNPHLGVRKPGFKDPLRIILDSTLRIPKSAHVLRDSNCIIATTKYAPLKKRAYFEKKGKRVWVCKTKNGNVSLKDLTRKMYGAKIISVFVEGGGEVFTSFYNEGLYDDLFWFMSSKICGDPDAPGITLLKSDHEYFPTVQHIDSTVVFVYGHADGGC